MSKMSRWTVLLTLVMAAALVLPPAADACTTYRCKLVEHPTNPYCIACVDTGAPTGANCGSNGPCSCYFVQCPFTQHSSLESPLDGVLTAEPNACPADGEAQEPASESVPVAAQTQEAAA